MQLVYFEMEIMKYYLQFTIASHLLAVVAAVVCLIPVHAIHFSRVLYTNISVLLYVFHHCFR